MVAPAERVNLNHLMYVRYKHTDLLIAHKLLLDFGFDVVKKTANMIWYRGFGGDPVCYISEKSEDGQAQLLGGGWAVDNYDDLEIAARIPGASSIADCENPIGGKMVTLEDPTGGLVYVHWGHNQHSNEQMKTSKTLTFNKGGKEQRLKECQCLHDRLSRIRKIGHYGYEVSHSDFEAVRNWYFERLTLAPTDSLFDTETAKDVMTFAHVDKGERYVDYQVSSIQAVEKVI